MELRQVHMLALETVFNNAELLAILPLRGGTFHQFQHGYDVLKLKCTDNGEWGLGDSL